MYFPSSVNPLPCIEENAGPEFPIPVESGLAKMMKENPKMKIAIGGHTDSRGSDDYNMKLSNERAASVKQYLQKMGLDAGRMTIKNLGKSAPLTANETSADGAALNRRVDITIEE